MKNILFSLSLALVFAACGGTTEAPSETTEETTVEQLPAESVETPQDSVTIEEVPSP